MRQWLVPAMIQPFNVFDFDLQGGGRSRRSLDALGSQRMCQGVM
jgi:hypothetical protein